MASFIDWGAWNRRWMAAGRLLTPHESRVKQAIEHADTLLSREQGGSHLTLAEIEQAAHDLRVAVEPYGFGDDQRPADPLHAEIVSDAQGLFNALFLSAQAAANREGACAPRVGWLP